MAQPEIFSLAASWIEARSAVLREYGDDFVASHKNARDDWDRFTSDEQDEKIRKLRLVAR